MRRQLREKEISGKVHEEDLSWIIIAFVHIFLREQSIEIHRHPTREEL